MTTYTATRAGTLKPIAASGWAQQKQTAYGTIEVTTIPAATDIITMCKLPKGAVVIGGRLWGDKLASGATSASESMQIAIGIDAAATLADGTAAGAASMVNSLFTTNILSGIAVSVLKVETGYNMPLGGLLITSGPFRCEGDANVNIVIQASAGAGSFISGTLSLAVDYVMGQHV